MTRIDYEFKTKGPLHTGSDVNAGIMQHLRRQKCILPEPFTYESRLSDDDRRNAVVQLCIAVWNSIDFDNIKGRRLMGIWDEFASKLTGAGRCADKYTFFDRLCRSWGIRSCTNELALNALDLLDSCELLDIIRNETIYVVLKMRALKDEAKENKDKTGRWSMLKIKKLQALEKPVVISRSDMEIPCISGNSIRGRLRRLAMYDFCKRIGLKQMDKRTYHTFFSGGFLDSSSKYEDFDRLDEICKRNPMMAIFGSAVGDMMIEGDMKVGWAYPLCRERGTSDKSVWESLDVVFQTRKDSSKTENKIDWLEEGLKLGGDEPPQQMKYEYETFADGTVFEHRFALLTEDPLRQSAFYHMLGLYLGEPFLGGKGAVGNGEIEILCMDTPPKAGNLYTKYIEENHTEMKEFWTNVKI